MSASVTDPVATQVRLVLERQCSDLGRELAAAFRLDFVLFLFDFGAGGNLAYFSSGAHEIARLAVEHYVSRGITPVLMSTEEAARHLESVRSLARVLRSRCPAGVGFVLLFFRPAAGEPEVYLASAEREDARRMLEEWLARAREAGKA